MTLNEFQARLQAVNPRLRIKRYGNAKAGVHLGNQYICRVPQGEITAYSVIQPSIGYATDKITASNPRGAYRYDLIQRRGRHAVARLLQGKGLIAHADIAPLSR